MITMYEQDHCQLSKENNSIRDNKIDVPSKKMSIDFLGPMGRHIGRNIYGLHYIYDLVWTTLFIVIPRQMKH